MTPARLDEARRHAASVYRDKPHEYTHGLLVDALAEVDAAELKAIEWHDKYNAAQSRLALVESAYETHIAERDSNRERVDAAEARVRELTEDLEETDKVLDGKKAELTQLRARVDGMVDEACHWLDAQSITSIRVGGELSKAFRHYASQSRALSAHQPAARTPRTLPPQVLIIDDDDEPAKEGR